MLDDDNVCVHPLENAKEIVKWLKTTGLPWSVMMDFTGKFDENMIKYMEECGLTALRVGVESFCTSAMSLMCPRKSVERQLELIDFVIKHTKLSLFISMQHDILGETPDGRFLTDRMNEEFRRLYSTSNGRINSQYPVDIIFPSTPGCNLLMDKGLWLFKGKDPLTVPWHQYLDGATSCDVMTECNKKFNETRNK